MAEELSEISKFVSSYWNYYLELEEAFKQTQKLLPLTGTMIALTLLSI